jgi:flagellar basal-body rod protein FlgF
MNDAVAMTAISMSDDMQRLATISHNLANATTPGFKRDIALTGRFAHTLDALASRSVPAMNPGDPNSTIDQQNGSLRFTNNAFDVALEGPGFFELSGAEGPLYTRQGDFHLDGQGRLVNASGVAVMGTGGEIFLAGGEHKIERDGRIFEDGKQIAQLRVVQFSRPDGLLKAGNGQYAAAAGEAPTDAGTGDTKTHVRQGHLENSNVSSVNEMVRLIETIRHFESQQKVIQGYDEMLERVIRSLGDV